MQQELIEMLEEIIPYVEVWKKDGQDVLDKAEALVAKAKNNAPAVPQEVGLTDEERADMACAVAAICTGTSSRTIAATAIDWTERALRAKGGKL